MENNSIFEIDIFHFFFSFYLGTATGCAVNTNDLKSIHKKCKMPILIGSGVSAENVNDYFYKADAAIIGSYFKRDGHWCNELCEKRIAELMKIVNSLREHN